MYIGYVIALGQGRKWGKIPRKSDGSYENISYRFVKPEIVLFHIFVRFNSEPTTRVQMQRNINN